MAVAVAADPFSQGVLVHPFDRLFARRIDVGHDHAVGVGETGREVVHQVAQTGVAVRLDHGDDAALAHLTRRLQHGGDLDRVVAVIVHDSHPVHHARRRKAALDPAEPGQTLADRLVGYVQLARHGDGGQGVGDIVPARHRQVQIVNPVRFAVLDHHVEPGAVRPHLASLGPHHGLGIDAIGHQPPVIDRGDQLLHLGMIQTDGGEAVEGDVLDEVDEGLPHRVEVAVVVQVFRVDVGHDRNSGLEPQEAAVALIRLDHDPVAVPHLGVGAIGVDDAAVDHRRVQTGRIQQGRDHGGRCRLAVGAADRDGELQPHQFGQHLGPAHQGDATLARGLHLGIVGLDRRRIDHGRDALADMGGVVADEDLGPQLLQPFGIGAGLGVRALNRIADLQHDLGDAAHAYAADADEMDGTEVERDGAKASDHPMRLAIDLADCTGVRVSKFRSRANASRARNAGPAYDFSRLAFGRPIVQTGREIVSRSVE